MCIAIIAVLQCRAQTSLVPHSTSFRPASYLYWSVAHDTVIVGASAGKMVWKGADGWNVIVSRKVSHDMLEMFLEQIRQNASLRTEIHRKDSIMYEILKGMNVGYMVPASPTSKL